MAKSDIEDWRNLIEQGVRYKEKYGNSKRWSTYRDYARGIFPGYNQSVSGILPYNITYAMLHTLIPNIYFRNPYVIVSPRYKPGMQTYSKIVEAVDNWLIQELAVKSTMKMAAQEAYFTNRGIIKVGYDSLYGFSKDMTADLLGLSDTTFTQVSRKGERTEYNINVKPGMPWCVPVLADYFVVPFGARTLDDCPWVDHVIIRPLEDVKADPKYKNTAALEGTHMEMLYRQTGKAEFYRELAKDVNLVEIHEIRDLKRGEIKACVFGYDKWIRPPQEDVLQIEGLPFVDFSFNEDTEYYWSASDVQVMEPQQLEANEARTQALLHRRIALVKFIVQDKMIDDPEIDKMLSEDVGPVVKVKDVPSQVVQMLQPHIPVDLTQWVNVIREDVRELLGFSRQAMGEIPAGRRTKYEVSVGQMAKEIRVDERRDILADALCKLVRKINQIIFSRWDVKHVVQVVGVDAAKYWVEYTNKAIVGEYNIKVDVESMTPTTKALKRQEIVQLIQALGKYPGANVSHLLRLLLREFEWIDAMAVLPEAQETMGQPMQAQQFAQQQQKLAGSPAEMGARTRRSAAYAGGAF